MRANPIWTFRLKAAAVGIILALCALTLRHWYETFSFGHPLCEDCRADFPQFYAAAKLIWEKPSSLYVEESQLAIQRTIDSRIGDSLLPYTYPPTTALVLIPLGWLSFPGAFAAMTFINAVLLGASLALLIRRLALTGEQRTWLMLCGFCNFGVHSVFLQGQASFIILLLLTIFTFSVCETREVRAGWASGLVFIKPQWQLIPWIVMAAGRMWRAIATSAIIVIGLILLSWILVGWMGIQRYLDLLATYLTVERGYGSYPEAMHNLRALAQYLVPFSWSWYVWLGLGLPVLGATFLINAQPARDSKSVSVLWIANFCSSVLMAPHLYPHDLSTLLIPTAFSLKLFGEPVPLRLVLLLILIGVYPLIALTGRHALPPLVPIILLAVFWWCWKYLRQSA